MSTCSNCSNAILKTTSTTSQTLATGNPIPLQNNIFQSGCGISHIAGSTAISLTRTGTYLVAVTATGNAGASNTFSIQAYNNGTAIPAAIASLVDTGTVHFTTLVKVLPSCSSINNNANLTFVNTGATTYSTVEVDIVKVG